MSDDRQLLKALKRGDDAAWRQIYLKYKDDLLTVARSLVCDVETAEDCLQEVFVALVSNGCAIRSNLKGYLLSCVVNRARGHLRRRCAQSNCQVNMRSRTPTQRFDAGSPANVLAQQDQTLRVAGALEKLPIEQREVVVLRLQGDMKFRQIARMLDVSVNTAQSRYRYGIEKLRHLLLKKEAT
ncbi:MAG: RNA polymerase sigma factor [Planctomycetota bacterium]|jgi:RNA polymerase sigma-70 factor (ECF subfamily)